ncbi:cation diffusion facilitator family transporter [Rhodopirellula europaea]|uniref:Cation efflux system protein n=1 Tax=Rhodopirellula europaea SH398 TaxID=1263868 RepID=M5RXU0_9BACT|nr:cation diffusion facilitator family transporter [Rhodopirellula europaea]EMI24173.1 cation efflux system protein [Rhodopirellula europaea SH398]
MSEHKLQHDEGGHSHGLTRSDDLAGVSDLRLIWAVIINHILTVGEVIAGIFSGSVALLSDAAHNFNDANALLIAYIARKISKKEATERFTFGYRRAELLGAVINLTLLAVIGLYLVYEGIRRFFEPEEITGWLMAAASILALVIDVGTALLLWAMSKGSLNVRAAFVHNIVDAAGSVAVLIGAGAIIWLQWNWVDPVLTLVLSAYILYQVYAMLPKAMRILMEGTPVDLDVQDLVDEVEKLEGVEGLHHLHVWELDEQNRALEAHIVIDRESIEQFHEIKQRIKERLAHDFEINHSTLEFEYTAHTCDDGETAVIAGAASRQD